MVARARDYPVLASAGGGCGEHDRACGILGDPGYATEALTAAGFTDAALEERNLDIDLPPTPIFLRRC